MSKMFYKLVILTQSLIHFIVLSKSDETKAQNYSKNATHSKAGNYSWDTDNTCGLVNITESRIRDGIEAQLGEFPWMAAIFVTFEPPSQIIRPIAVFGCGGAIISDYWLITAKHCLQFSKKVLNIEIYVGSKYKFESFTVPPHQVATFMFHSEVDIALVRVKKRIERSFYKHNYRINRICVPKLDIMNHQKEAALMSGFGQVDKEGLKPSYTLRKAQYIIESVEECKRLYNFPSETICAKEDKHITCYGDSGSALLQFDGKRAVVIGIVSFHGPNQNVCDSGYIVFARVSPFVGWIQNIIESDEPIDWTPKPIPPLFPNNPTLGRTETTKVKPLLTSNSPEAAISVKTTTSDSYTFTPKTVSITILMVFPTFSFKFN